MFTRKPPSATEYKCPDCDTMLSCQADLKLHRNTQHPDGTKVKAQCPYPDCRYEAYQKSNLKAHINANHSDEPQYPCPNCHKFLTSAIALIRHRKIVHDYHPCNTLSYLFKGTSKDRGEATLSKTRDHHAVVPHSTQNAPSSTGTGSL